MPAVIGHKISPKTKEKIRQALTGRTRGHYNIQMSTPKENLCSPDRGCDLASAYLGVGKGNARCEFCPFPDCIKFARPDEKLKELYRHPEEFVRWISKYRKLSVDQLHKLTGYQKDTIKKILRNGH